MEPSNEALQRGLEALRSEIAAARAEAGRRAEMLERAEQEAATSARRAVAVAAVGVVAVGAAVGGGLAVRAAGRAHHQSVAVPAPAASNPARSAPPRAAKQPGSGSATSPANAVPPATTASPATAVPPAKTPRGVAGVAARGGAVEAAVTSPAAHRVNPGESFWTVAQAVMGRRLGSPPSDAETAWYWVKLLAANRSVVAATGNADLVYPGTVLTLPDGG